MAKKSKYKKRADGRYLVQILIEYLPNGRPKYKHIYARTIIELEEKVAQFRAQLNAGIRLDKKYTLAAWSKIWFDTYKKGLSYGTTNMYKVAIKHISTSSISKKQLSAISHLDLQQFLNRKALKMTRMVEILKITLCQIFSRAVENMLIPINPARELHVPTSKHKKSRTLTEQEEYAILNADFSPEERAFIYLILFAGLRRGECLALKKLGNNPDIDLSNDILCVNKTIVFNTSCGTVKDSPKTDCSNRQNPIISPLKEALVHCVVLNPQSELLFSYDNSFVSRAWFNALWNRITSKIIVSAIQLGYPKPPHLTSHILRHTFATYLAAINLNPKISQNLMGHSSINMTLDVYTHLPLRSRFFASPIFSFFHQLLPLQNSCFS